MYRSAGRGLFRRGWRNLSSFKRKSHQEASWSLLLWGRFTFVGPAAWPKPGLVTRFGEQFVYLLLKKKSKHRVH